MSCVLPRCSHSSVRVFSCTHCEKDFHACAKHTGEVRHLCEGHRVRVHPELESELVRKWARSAEAVALLRRNAAVHPPLWAKLLAAVERELGS